MSNPVPGVIWDGLGLGWVEVRWGACTWALSWNMVYCMLGFMVLLASMAVVLLWSVQTCSQAYHQEEEPSEEHQRHGEAQPSRQDCEAPGDPDPGAPQGCQAGAAYQEEGQLDSSALNKYAACAGCSLSPLWIWGGRGKKRETFWTPDSTLSERMAMLDTSLGFQYPYELQPRSQALSSPGPHPWGTSLYMNCRLEHVFTRGCIPQKDPRKSFVAPVQCYQYTSNTPDNNNW